MKRQSHQRQVLISQLMNRIDHPTAVQLYDELKAKNESVGIATIYRNLELLSRKGKISVITNHHGISHFDPSPESHPHFCCIHCGRVEDIPFDNPSPTNLPSAFLENRMVGRVELVIKGVCPECMSKGLLLE